MFKSLLALDQPLGSIQPPTTAYSANSDNPSILLGAGKNIESFISNGIGVLTILGGIFCVFYFVMAGINWITAGGEQSKITKARDQMVQSIFGIVVIVASYALIGVIGTILGLDLLHPAQLFCVLSPTGKCQ